MVGWANVQTRMMFWEDQNQARQAYAWTGTGTYENRKADSCQVAAPILVVRYNNIVSSTVISHHVLIVIVLILHQVCLHDTDKEYARNI